MPLSLPCQACWAGYENGLLVHVLPASDGTQMLPCPPSPSIRGGGVCHSHLSVSSSSLFTSLSPALSPPPLPPSSRFQGTICYGLVANINKDNHCPLYWLASPSPCARKRKGREIGSLHCQNINNDGTKTKTQNTRPQPFSARAFPPLRPGGSDPLFVSIPRPFASPRPFDSEPEARAAL